MILLPTRVTETSATIVDNIFTNNLVNTVTSGNITTDFSDHYSQLVTVKNLKMDIKSTTIYKRDYSTFSEESFRDDVSIQNFNNQLTDVNEQFNDFLFKLEESRGLNHRKISAKSAGVGARKLLNTRVTY